MTGREVILKSGGDDRIVSAIEAMGYVCVPRIPSKEMMDAAYWAAVGEDAEGVWEEMLKASTGALEAGNPGRKD